MARLRSVTLHNDGDDASQMDIWVDKLSPSLPWSQLRSIEIDDIPFSNLRLIVNILRQIPMLQSLSLTIIRSHLNSSFSSLEDLTLPSLSDFSLYIGVEIALDEILCSFTFPCLTKFTLGSGLACWTRKTFSILAQQYNMQNLHEVRFSGGFALTLSISPILRNAPMLRSLSVRWDTILDDQAITGISDGTLGRCLQRLEIPAAIDLGEVLDIAIARKKKVDEMIKNGCSWKEDIALLKEIKFVRNFGSQKVCDDEKLRSLKDAGITVTYT